MTATACINPRNDDRAEKASAIDPEPAVAAPAVLGNHLTTT